MRIELGPTNGSRKLELSPAVSTSGEAVNTVPDVGGVGDDHHRRVGPRGAERERDAEAGGAAAQQHGRPRQPLPGLEGGRGGRAGRQHRPETLRRARVQHAEAVAAAARRVTAELAGADGEQLEIQRAGAERVGDGEPAVERERGLDRAVDLGHEHGVVGRGVGQELPGGAVAVERAEADERGGVGRRGGADDDVGRLDGRLLRRPARVGPAV